MKNKTTIRQTNFELMKIISMFYIVIYHVMIHGKFLAHSDGKITYILIFIHSLIIIGVNSFVMVTGYFQYNKKIKLTKIISINNATWFYKVLFLSLVLIFNVDVVNQISTIDKFKTIMPIDYGIYWFINCYIVLYMISPLLNKIIENTNRKQHLKIIALLCFLFSLIPTLTSQEAIQTDIGRSTINFILLYFIGSYIAKYPIEEKFKALSKTALRTISIIGYILCAILLVMCFSISTNLNGLSSIMTEIAKIFDGLCFSYSSPLIIIETIFYFYIFKTISLKNKFINKIAKYTIGIYLIHENIYVRDNLYNYLGILKIKNIYIKQILLMIGVSIVLFIISMFIEIVRTTIFKFIYTRKLSKKIRESYQKYFKNLGINMPW